MDTTTPARRLQIKATEVLAQVKLHFKCSQRALDCVVEGTNSLFDLFLEVMKSKVTDELLMFDGYISLSRVHGIIESFKGQSLFEGTSSSVELEKSINYHSSKKPVTLMRKTVEYKTVWKNGVPSMKSWKHGYFVPFLDQLGQLLQCKDVLDCIENPIPHESDRIRTITDSLFYRYHSVVLNNPMSNILVFGVYVDDVEPCDSLKSKCGKHTLRLFYWTLFNIHPDKRSSLRAINLLAIVKKTVAKEFGNTPFMKNFIDGLKALGEEGVYFDINGEKVLFHGILHSAQGDTPAMANLGGFKEGHFALRPCRLCMAKNNELCEHFEEVPTLLRNKEDHEKFLKEVLSQANLNETEEEIAEDVDLDGDVDMEEVLSREYDDHQNPSVNYGINGPSILAEAPGFDVTKCLALDMMHTMAEGVIETVCRRILKDCCLPPHPSKPGCLAAGRLKLSVLNDAIENLGDYGHMNRDKPSRIEVQHLKSKLRQSAAQMNLLANILPFILKGNLFFSPKKEELLICVLKFNKLCMLFEFSNNDIDNISIQSKKLGEILKSVYSDIRTLKLHSLRHLATQVRLLGPLRQLACYRYEAMHTEFTSNVPVVRTKKDIALTLGKRHVLKRSAEIMEAKASGSFLYKGDDLVKPVAKTMCDLPSVEQQALLESVPQCDNSSVLVKVRKIKKSGITWQENSIVSMMNSVYGQVKSIYLLDGCLIFTIQKLGTVFDPSVNAHLVESCQSALTAVVCDNLSCPCPIAKFTFAYGRCTKVYLVDMSPGNVEGGL